MLLLLLRPWRKVSVAADLVERGVINAQRPHASITLPCLRTSVSSFAILAVLSILHSPISELLPRRQLREPGKKLLVAGVDQGRASRSHLESLGQPCVLEHTICGVTADDVVWQGKAALRDGAVPDLMTAFAGAHKRTSGIYEKSDDLSIVRCRHLSSSDLAIDRQMNGHTIALLHQPVLDGDLGSDLGGTIQQMLEGISLRSQREFLTRAAPHSGLGIKKSVYREFLHSRQHSKIFRTLFT